MHHDPVLFKHFHDTQTHPQHRLVAIEAELCQAHIRRFMGLSSDVALSSSSHCCLEKGKTSEKEKEWK